MPRFSKTAKAFLVVAAAVIVAVGGALAWWLQDDAPAAVSIEAAADAAADDATETRSSDPGGSGEGDPAGENSAATTDLDGTWEVVGSGDDPAAGTFVGYRIEEELAGIGGATAVGRTEDVTGSLTVAGEVVESVEVTADLTTLQSDSSRRDGALRTRGLETASFPEATFVLTEPVALPTDAASRAPFTITAAGDFTLHGVTRPVELDLDVQLLGEAVVVVGTLPIALTDYDIDAPTGMRVLSIAGEGAAEFQLRFARP